MAENAPKTSFKKTIKAADSADVTSLKKSLKAADNADVMSFQKSLKAADNANEMSFQKSLKAAARKERELLAAIKKEANGATSDAIINGFQRKNRNQSAGQIQKTKRSPERKP